MSISRPRRPLRAVVLLVAVALSAGGAACSDDDEGSAASTTAVVAPVSGRAEVLTTLADGVILPSYVRLGEGLDALEIAATTLCATPGEGSLDQARSAWREAVTAWETTTAFGIGPAMEHRLMSAVGFAARPESIQRLLDGGGPVDVETVRSEGAAVRGLFAAEHVLYDEAAGSLTTVEGARSCEYLRSVATLAAEAAAVVVDEWVNGEARGAFTSATGSEPDGSLPLLLNEVTHRVKAIDEQGLRDIAAADAYDTLADGRRDGPGAFALARQRAALRGAVAVIGSGSNGLVGMVRERSPETADRLEVAASTALDAVDDLPESVRATFDEPDGAALVAVAAEEVAALKVVLGTEVASQLGVTITLSDGDGDA